MENNTEYELDELIYYTSTERTKRLSGRPLKLYRYILIGLFINTIETNKSTGIRGRQNIYQQHSYYRHADMVLKNPMDIDELYSSTIKEVEKKMVENFFHNIYEDNTVVKINEFFRDKLTKLKSGKRFWKSEEFEKIFSVHTYFQKYYIPIKNHHWIDFNIYIGLTPTFPELITYNDLITSWNLNLDKTSDFKSLPNTPGNYSELKHLEYEIFALQRYSYTSCVTFFESYLFYLFYNLKAENVLIEKQKVEKLYDLPYIAVNDEDILDTIIKPYYIKKHNKDVFNSFYKDYKKLNKIRNSIIHTSAFESLTDSNDATMELFMSLDIELDTLKEAFKLVVDFTLFIESILPDEHKVLFWWDRFEDPDFDSKKKISTRNKGAL